MSMKEKEEKIKELIDNISPFIEMEGGSIEFIKYEDDYVYVRLAGACVNCLLQDNTLNDGILNMIQEEIPSVKGVINVPL